jgi:hypothetical protein
MTRHLIHVGYPKAGSTFLQAWFELHPALHYRPGGIAGFGDVYAMCGPLDPAYRWHVTSCEGLSAPHDELGWLREHRPGAPARAPGRLRERQEEVCALLRSLHPESVVLIVTRGFPGLVLSGYSQYVRSGGTLHPGELSPAATEFLGLDERHYWDYSHLVGLYRDAFGDGGVIVLPYELLRDDPRRFLQVLETRLGIGHVEPEVGRVNPSLSPAELYWYPLLSRAVWGAASRLGGRAGERLRRWYAPRVLEGRLGPLVRALERLRPGRRVTRADFPPDVLRHFAGRAELLRGDPLYAPYAAEYLWDGDPAGA